MGCTGAKASKAESDIDRYHQELFTAAQTGDVKRLKDILDELDKRKASTIKKEVLNMGMSRCSREFYFVEIRSKLFFPLNCTDSFTRASLSVDLQSLSYFNYIFRPMSSLFLFLLRILHLSLPLSLPRRCLWTHPNVRSRYGQIKRCPNQCLSPTIIHVHT